MSLIVIDGVLTHISAIFPAPRPACPTRRALLGAIAVSPLALAACTPAQVDAALAKIKTISGRVVIAATDWFGSIPIAAPIINRLRDNDALIQAATTIGDAVRAGVTVLTNAISDLLALASLAPIPATVLTALTAINEALKAFLSFGAAPAAASSMAAAPAPSLADAEAIAVAIPRRR
jgi:hypothetical protein